MKGPKVKETRFPYYDVYLGKNSIKKSLKLRSTYEIFIYNYVLLQLH